MELNATQGSLLGFLHDGPKTGWDLLQVSATTLARFWNVTSSHVYRELKTLASRGLVAEGPPGRRDRRPYEITDAGREAFREWIAQEPGPEQIRMPLLVTLWFGRHLDRETLSKFLVAHRQEHAARLAMYRDVDIADPYVDAVVQFGVAYERAIVEWIDQLEL